MPFYSDLASALYAAFSLSDAYYISTVNIQIASGVSHYITLSDVANSQITERFLIDPYFELNIL